MSNLLKNIIRFILLILVQVFVLNKIILYELINPYLYLLFILLLPINIPRPALLFLGLVTGLCIDMFMNTMGMHAAACVLIAYLRPFILNILSPQGGFEMTAGKSPSLSTLGLVPFITYATILILIHHAVYFTLEVFGFSNLWYLLLKILGSAAVTLGLVLLCELLFYRKAGRK